MWTDEVLTIELQKTERGLGFSILDYQDPLNPTETVIVIRSLVPGGVAQQDGRLIPGDRLMFVNNVHLLVSSIVLTPWPLTIVKSMLSPGLPPTLKSSLTSSTTTLQLANAITITGTKEFNGYQHTTEPHPPSAPHCSNASDSN